MTFVSNWPICHCVGTPPTFSKNPFQQRFKNPPPFIWLQSQKKGVAWKAARTTARTTRLLSTMVDSRKCNSTCQVSIVCVVGFQFWYPESLTAHHWKMVLRLCGLLTFSLGKCYVPSCLKISRESKCSHVYSDFQNLPEKWNKPTANWLILNCQKSWKVNLNADQQILWQTFGKTLPVTVNETSGLKPSTLQSKIKH